MYLKEKKKKLEFEVISYTGSRDCPAPPTPKNENIKVLKKTVQSDIACVSLCVSQNCYHMGQQETSGLLNLRLQTGLLVDTVLNLAKTKE